MMVEFDMKKVTNASVVLRALKNSTRERIFKVIQEHPGIKVTELYVKLNIEQAVASQHLAILRQSGIVRTKREGRMIHYYLHDDNIRKIARLVEQLSELYIPGMSSLGE
jgi:DNA-binding transcriptional ArsR family regulator